jgi:hypothetical protein
MGSKKGFEGFEEFGALFARIPSTSYQSPPPPVTLPSPGWI